MKEIAPGLFQLSGLPPNAINVYLAEDVLIDAATRMARGRIMRQIKDRPLSALALTHAHPDHQGAAKAICEARGIPLACHAGDVEAMENGVLVQPGPHQDTLINKIDRRRCGRDRPTRSTGSSNEGDESPDSASSTHPATPPAR